MSSGSTPLRNPPIGLTIRTSDLHAENDNFIAQRMFLGKEDLYCAKKKWF